MEENKEVGVIQEMLNVIIVTNLKISPQIVHTMQVLHGTED